MHLSKNPQDTSSSIFSMSSVEAENCPSITVHLKCNQTEKKNYHHLPGPCWDVKPQRFFKTFRKGKQNQQPNPANKKKTLLTNIVSTEAKLHRMPIRKAYALLYKTMILPSKAESSNKPESKYGRESCPYGCGFHDTVAGTLPNW